MDILTAGVIIGLAFFAFLSIVAVAMAWESRKQKECKGSE